jgi:hypothetical protein
LVVIEIIPLIAIPVVVVSHWQTAWAYFRETGRARSGSSLFRMSHLERAVTFAGTLALYVYLAVVIGRGDDPNHLAAAATVGFTIYLALDFVVGLRSSHRDG